ncbi:MAG: hypothetical protein H0T75_15310 [Rhizobiales bacterium]|nr:hypothetical protein [Hyphomicrobiales bacterium]
MRSGRRVAERLRQGFFRNPFDALLTMLIVAAAAYVLPAPLRWFAVEATFFGPSRGAFSGGGACWAFITANLGQIVYGFYPTDERWRVDLVGLITVVALVVFPLVVRRRLSVSIDPAPPPNGIPPFAVWSWRDFRPGSTDVSCCRCAGVFPAYKKGGRGVIESQPDFRRF